MRMMMRRRRMSMAAVGANPAPHVVLGLLVLLVVVVVGWLELLLLLGGAGAAAADLQLLLHDEMMALLEFRSALHDPSGILDRSWRVVHISSNSSSPLVIVNYSASPCSWSGVACNNNADAVVSLDLSSRNLSGFISPSIARLRRLRFLSLALNNLSGPLPPDIIFSSAASSSLLRHLNLSNNLLSGTFPPPSGGGGGAASHLQTLDLYNNNLQGPLPAASIATLGATLRHLHLGGNYFNGSIPPQLASLPRLSYLALSGNSLTGRIPPQLGDLANLRELYLGYYNQFDDGIPPSFARLTQLQVLDMAHCGLSGVIPPALFTNLTRLHSLFLFTNSLSGPLPPSLASASSLRFLDLSNNLLSGPIPPDLFRNLSSLHLLHLFRNDLAGPIPPAVAHLPALQVLSLWQNRLTGTLPRRLGSNATPLLSYLDVSTNNLSGSIPPHVCGDAGMLEALILFDNFFSGPFPEMAADNCSQLARIRAGHNLLSGEIPAGLLALPNLQYLEIPSNDLNGAIPADILATSQLGRLDLSGNRLHAAIPPSIGNLAMLETLLLGGNLLDGSLPPELGRLRRLSKFDCSHNQVAGGIPPAIALCSSLTFLDLSRNHLDGPIPAQLRSLAVLNSLNLSYNSLTGTIPDSLQDMQTLTEVDFSYNNLSGPIPQGGQFAAFNATSFVGNAALCGAPLPIACTPSTTGGGAWPAAPAPQTRRNDIVYWLIVGVMSALTVGVVTAALLYNRATVREYCRCRGGGGERAGPLCGKQQAGEAGGGGRAATAWKLTVFQKVDFTASHVVACLKEENVIGKGGSGTVYRCATPGGGWVAVKRLMMSEEEGDEQQMVEVEGCFKAEIETVGRIRHRNIVRLVGWCSNSGGDIIERSNTNSKQLLLVYEYMGNGSVGELLHGGGGGGSGGAAAAHPLDWGRRWRIAMDAANGLRYLHHDCNPRIIHRDVKSNNILLDSKFEAHVADFGLARLLPAAGNSPAHMSSVAGSYGYIAPEYVYTLTVDEKSDIYSFGIVLLELLTGKRPVEPEFGEGVNIAVWARRRFEGGECRELVDPRLEKEMAEQPAAAEQAEQMLRVALLCTAELPLHRPTMRQVVQLLQQSGKGGARRGAVVAAGGEGSRAEASLLLLGGSSTSASYSSSSVDLISI